MIAKFLTNPVCFFIGLAIFISSPVRADLDDFACGALQNSYGPYDYRNDKDKLKIVEDYHFTPGVANLSNAKTGYLGGDIDYTLRAFPNHPRALMAMIQLGEREKTTKVPHANYSVECYLTRAIRFKNDDPTVKMIYANFLAKKGRGKEALKQLNDAVLLDEDSANFQYNVGLIYFELREYEKSLLYAQKAYLSGFPLPGLREKLKKVGKWREPKPSSELGSDSVSHPISEKRGEDDL